MTYACGASLHNNEFNLRCDGCEKMCRSSQLSPVGDGSIMVCAGCYSAATAMLSTKPRSAAPLSPSAAASKSRAVVTTLTQTGSLYQSPLDASSVFSRISAGSGPPVGTMNFAHES